MNIRLPGKSYRKVFTSGVCPNVIIIRCFLACGLLHDQENSVLVPQLL